MFVGQYISVTAPLGVRRLISLPVTKIGGVPPVTKIGEVVVDPHRARLLKSIAPGLDLRIDPHVRRHRRPSRHVRSCGLALRQEGALG